VVDVDPAEHLAATHTPALIALGITYDWVRCCGRRHAAWTVNHRNSADFDFVHFLFSCLCFYFPLFRLACPDHFDARIFRRADQPPPLFPIRSGLVLST
jgi:hypothetical protein